MFVRLKIPKNLGYAFFCHTTYFSIDNRKLIAYLIITDKKKFNTEKSQRIPKTNYSWFVKTFIQKYIYKKLFI